MNADPDPAVFLNADPDPVLKNLIKLQLLAISLHFFSF